MVSGWCNFCGQYKDDIKEFKGEGFVLDVCKDCLKEKDNIPKEKEIPLQTDTRKDTRYIASISKRTLNQFQYLCILGVLGVFFYLFTSLDFSNLMGIFRRTDVIINGTLGIIAVWFCWKLFRNELSLKFKIKEYKPKIKQQKILPVNKDVKSIYPLIGLILCLPFVLLNIIYIWASYPSGKVTIIYNHFNELLPELILFNIVFVIILFLTYKTYKNLKATH